MRKGTGGEDMLLGGLLRSGGLPCFGRLLRSGELPRETVDVGETGRM
jgi:hypothetical protein